MSSKLDTIRTLMVIQAEAHEMAAEHLKGHPELEQWAKGYSDALAMVFEMLDIAELEE